MYASMNEVEKFFESSVWYDIREILSEDLEMGLNIITDPSVNDVSAINYNRGKIEVLKGILSIREQLLTKYEIDTEDALSETNNEEE